MGVLPDSDIESKGNGAAPPSRRHDPATVVSFPTILTPEQRRQQAVWRHHARALNGRLAVNDDLPLAQDLGGGHLTPGRRLHEGQ